MFGNPKKIVSDRGTAFTSLEFENFLKEKKIVHRLVAVAAPWANGLVERVNRFLKSSLGKLVDELQDWHSNLETVQYVLNNTFHSSLKSSPSKLLLGFDQRNHEDAALVECLKKIARSHLNPDEDRETCRELALDTINKIKNYNKIYYDKRHLKPSTYKKGDYVLIKDVVKPGESKKFKQKYKGPYLIAKVLNKNRYVVTDIPGFNLSSRPYNYILSPDRLKPWVKPVKSINSD